MIQSMTAYARSETTIPDGEIVWELRTVNHRYLDLTLRLPDTLRQAETVLRSTLNQKLSRGKVECILNFSPQNSAAKIEINMHMVEQIEVALDTINHVFHASRGPNQMDILRWPGVIEPRAVTDEEKILRLNASLATALNDLIATRQREGSALKELLLQELDHLDETATQIRAKQTDINKMLRERLLERLQVFSIEVDAHRFEQELVMQLQKIDVTEELDRLTTHSQEVRRVLKNGGVVGRRLDFLMQELNREANTLGAKSPDAKVSNQVVDLKVAIEKMREQVQNIE